VSFEESSSGYSLRVVLRNLAAFCNIAQVSDRRHLETYALLYVPPGLTFRNSVFCPHSCIYVFFSYGSQNKQRLFPYTTLTDWFLQQRHRVFTVRYGLGLLMGQIQFVLKGLMYHAQIYYIFIFYKCIYIYIYIYIYIRGESYKEICWSGLALVHRIRKQFRAIQEASLAKLR
jgi:hypothetical protein